ncbi:MAG: hypothetical protein K5766_03555 [Alphaproteobacteria bacterium]|nr:hypothetical protein [Alphaproteobacteria bacterium]
MIWNMLRHLGVKYIKRKTRSGSGKATKIYRISKKHERNRAVFVAGPGIERHFIASIVVHQKENRHMKRFLV